MGQKTHPLGFRLGIIQDHKSTWYSNFNQYANILKEDDKIRTYINSIASINSISNVQINRNGLNDQIQLNLVGVFVTEDQNDTKYRSQTKLCLSSESGIDRVKICKRIAK